MAILEHSRKAIDDFFAAIEPLAGAYQNSSFSYVAVKNGAQFTLVKGSLFLVVPSSLPFSSFASASVLAGHQSLEELAESPRSFVELLIDGKIRTPGVDIEFPASHTGEYLAAYQPFHPAGLQNQNRLNALTISGADQRCRIHQPDLDWELKAGATPYDGIQELMNEYGLGLRGDTVSVEIVASSVAAVDFSSPVIGKRANLRVRLANGLLTEKFKLGYRVFSQGRVVERKRLDGEAFRWISGADAQQGSAELNVAEGSILHCFASYDGLTQHFGWLADQSTTQNARRAAYEAFDPGLETLKSIIPGGPIRGRDARELESVVAWILWMLGFSVVHLGSTTRMQDAADLLATTPSGHIAVIECTTGLLKAENKLALLHDRSQAVRRALDASGASHLRLLTVMVTSQPRSDVEVDIEPAERLRILVLTRENLDQLINLTLIPQNPEQIFVETEEAVRFAQAKHGPQQPAVL
jgi:hypothetical protein